MRTERKQLALGSWDAKAAAAEGRGDEVQRDDVRKGLHCDLYRIFHGFPKDP